MSTPTSPQSTTCAAPIPDGEPVRRRAKLLLSRARALLSRNLQGAERADLPLSARRAPL
jgi:hypothetical protein